MPGEGAILGAPDGAAAGAFSAVKYREQDGWVETGQVGTDG